MRQDEKIKERVNAIFHFYHENKRMPTYSEIAEMFGWRSKNAVFKFIEKLVKLNIIEKDQKGKLIPTFCLNPLKVLGVVEAGFPSPAEEELLDTISLDRWLINNPTSTFMLKVTGVSMSEAGILPNDVVLVDRSFAPKNGDIVIAQVDGEWTMKYFTKKANEIILNLQILIINL